VQCASVLLNPPQTLIKRTVFPGFISCPSGPVFRQTPFRLKVDAELARDPRTASIWQRFASSYLGYLTNTESNEYVLDDAHAMRDVYRDAMKKAPTISRSVNDLHDCSDIIPVPVEWSRLPTLARGKSMADLKHHVSTASLASAVTDGGVSFSALGYIVGSCTSFGHYLSIASLALCPFDFFILLPFSLLCGSVYDRSCISTYRVILI
jgi:hypothetical protein